MSSHESEDAEPPEPPGSGSVRLNHQLIAAIGAGDIRAVRRALKAGANPNTSSNGYPLLTVAAVSRANDIAQALLDAGADVEARDNSGMTALMYLASIGSTDEHVLMFDALVAHGADVNATSAAGLRAADYTASLMNRWMALRLVSAHAEGAKPATRETLRTLQRHGSLGR